MMQWSVKPDVDRRHIIDKSGRLLRALMVGLCSALVMLPLLTAGPRLAVAQTADPAPAPVASGSDETSPEPYSDEELEVLVARIALYPDDLVAVILSASLFPLQIVEAARFLEAHAKDPTLEPKSTWDGSVIALLNYPEIVRMMSDDLDWTQQLGEALINQQKDVLIAIQQLRDEAVAANVISSDDKVTVTKDNDNIVIQSASPENIYIPQYQPEMLYDSAYALTPVTYPAVPYPSYFWPTATFFTGAITGAIWASAVDWNDWNVWGGRWRGDVYFNCNNCLKDRHFNGRLNFNDVDWKNIDRSRLHIDRDRLNAIDRNRIRQGLDGDHRNALRAKAADIRQKHPGGPAGGQAGDIRRNALQKVHADGGVRPNLPSKINRPTGVPKPGGRIDHRPKVPSGLGEIRNGKSAQIHSARGAAARGGGQRAMPHRQGGGGRPPVRAHGRRH